MKFTIDSGFLNKALKQVQPAMSTNRITPILETVLFDIQKDKCFITATNLSLSITTELPCINEKPFKACLPYKKLLNISGVLSKQPITIEYGKNIQLTSVKEKYELGKPEDEKSFPRIENFEESFSLNVGEDLLYYLKLSVNCVGADKSNYIWHDVFFEVEKGEINIVATDAMRLFKYTEKTNIKESFKGAIDTNLITAINGSSEAKISGNNKMFRVECDSLVITGRMSENKSPGYQSFFTPYNHNCKINRSELMDALNKLMVFDGQFYTAKITFTKEGININYKNFDTEEQFSTDISMSHDVEFESVSVNAAHLKNLLSLMPEVDVVNFYFESPQKAIHVDNPEANMNLIIMPLVNN